MHVVCYNTILGARARSGAPPLPPLLLWLSVTTPPPRREHAHEGATLLPAPLLRLGAPAPL